MLKGAYATSVSLIAAAVASCIMLGIFVWTTERTASEARLLAEVQQQALVLEEVVQSGVAIAALLLQHPEGYAVFAGNTGQVMAAEPADRLLQRLLDGWLGRTSLISGVVARSDAGNILGQAGAVPAQILDVMRLPGGLQASTARLQWLSGARQFAVTVPVRIGMPGTGGAIALLLPESALALRDAGRKSRWRSAQFSPLAALTGPGSQLLHPVPGRSAATDQELRARDKRNPGLLYVDDIVVAWSAIRDDATGVYAQVDVDEFLHSAEHTALAVTSGAAAVLLFAGLLVMLRTRKVTRRLAEELAQLRGELTAQIREEHGLLANTAQMSTAARLAAIGHWVTQRTDSGWVWTAATPEIARIYGVPRRRLIGALEFSRQVVHPEDQARMHAIWDEVNRNPRRYEAEFRLIQPSGAIRHVVEVGEPVFDQHGVLINFHGTMQDITDYRHSEKVVSEAEARLHQQPASATVCHWVSYENPDDVSDSRYTYSQSAINLFGVPFGELPLRFEQMTRFIHAEDLARVTGQYREAGLSPAPYTICYRLVRPDGSILWVEETSEPAFSADGGITHTFGSLTEVPPPPGSR